MIFTLRTYSIYYPKHSSKALKANSLIFITYIKYKISDTRRCTWMWYKTDPLKAEYYNVDFINPAQNLVQAWIYANTMNFRTLYKSKFLCLRSDYQILMHSASQGQCDVFYCIKTRCLSSKSSLHSAIPHLSIPLHVIYILVPTVLHFICFAFFYIIPPFSSVFHSLVSHNTVCNF
jgi:hypothetical protein